MNVTNNTSPLSVNASVHASAGSGKTYLLVSRLVRLVLLNTSPASILAITFTRKAAAEMQSRLMERLHELTVCTDEVLNRTLTELDLPNNKKMQQQARQLFEKLLHEPQSIRTTTFHAFCQDLLRRFPLEADVPPGFELEDKTATLRDEAWHALMSDASNTNNTKIVSNLKVLLSRYSPIYMHTLLDRFLSFRSDWWAYTQGKNNPLTFATDQLATHLNITHDTDPIAEFFNDALSLNKIKRYIALLTKHPTKTNQGIVNKITLGLTVSNNSNEQQCFNYLYEAYFTTQNTPRIHKASQTLINKLGEDGVEEFISLHELICSKISETKKQLEAIQLLQLNTAWLTAGQAYLDHYQKIKTEQRLLDFSDLEWKTYQLLTHANNALWIQYKLDESIDHLLIDEFQDTNPTQWHLILPILNELAAGQSERQRSVFIVGDAKQSIYRFRRANVKLLSQATAWLEENLDAERSSLNESWRSSPAVISFINTMFSEQADDSFEFEIHKTHRNELWGKVELLPIIQSSTEKPKESKTLRNPLLMPRAEKENLRFLHEGRQIANTIKDLVKDKIPVVDDKLIQPIRYQDILVLFRTRIHIKYFEQALREAGIPYLGADRGTLLESLEVNDMLNLLHWLVTPYDNLALSGILKSPLFTASDDDLLQLARCDEHDWFHALQQLATNNSCSAPLSRACKLLERWQILAGHIPVHDLLDRIYSEANVITRYKAAFPQYLATRVQANLIRFIELALEMDSGRYPSLTRFTAWIKELKQQTDDAPDSPSETGSDDRVTLMTIHAAKGLEAPVVFVADASYEAKGKSTAVMVDWPADSQQPTCFMLANKSEFMPDFVRSRFSQEDNELKREDTNLFYVAITRAKQYLFVSGSQPSRSAGLGWYGRIAQQYQIDLDEFTEPKILAESGTQPVIPETVEESQVQTVSSKSLNGPFNLEPGYIEIAPSRAVIQSEASNQDDEDARNRGITIHTMLEKLSSQPELSLTQVKPFIRFPLSDKEIDSCWQEAQTIINHSDFRHLFSASYYQKAYNEVPVMYKDKGKTVFGIIDRLLVLDDSVLIVDYKTHQQADKDNLTRLSEKYHSQLRLYKQGIQQLWPDHKIKAALLFTHCAALQPVAV